MSRGISSAVSGRHGPRGKNRPSASHTPVPTASRAAQSGARWNRGATVKRQRGGGVMSRFAPAAVAVTGNRRVTLEPIRGYLQAGLHVQPAEQGLGRGEGAVLEI